MAIEKDPASKGSETPASPPASAAPAVDEEKERLRAELASSQKAMGEIAQMVKDGKLKVVEENAAPKPDVEEDDTALVDRRELKKIAADINKQVAGAIIQTTTQTARLTRENTKNQVKAGLKNFSKYEKEVDALLDRVDPLVAARPDTIIQTYNVVAAQHKDEEDQEVRLEAIAQERERLRSLGVEIPEEEEEDNVPDSRIPASIPSQPRQGVAPAGNASVSRGATARRDASIKPLTRDEKIAASLFGITDAAEYRRYGDRTWSPDLLGSKGRQKF